MISPYCSIEGCERFREGKNELCASHAALNRKADRQIKTNVEKLESKKGIKKVSEKMGKSLKTYKGLRNEFLKMHVFCEAKLSQCTISATQVHHKAKRGKNMNNPDTFMAVCSECHYEIESVMSADTRRSKGFLI